MYAGVALKVVEGTTLVALQLQEDRNWLLLN